MKKNKKEFNLFHILCKKAEKLCVKNIVQMNNNKNKKTLNNVRHFPK